MKNILIVRVSAIGDVIHTLPAVIMLKTLEPNTIIHWIVQKKAASLLHNQTFVDHVIELPDHYLSFKNLSNTINVIKNLSSIKWDAIIDFQGLLKTSLLYTLLKGKKYSFDAQHAKTSWTSWLAHKTIAPDWTNIIQKNLALTSIVAQDLFNSTSNPSIELLRQYCKLTIPPEDQHNVNTWIKTNKIKNYITLAPNTTWLSKHWPTPHWQTLITNITQHSTSTSIVLLGVSFGDQAKQLAKWVQDNNLNVFIAPPWNLLTTAHLIQQSSLLIAPDTGILHLADFIGTKSIALFGPTQKHKHGPFLQTLNQHYGQQASCVHSYKKNHGTQKNIDDLVNCMYTLAPNQVYDAIVQYLNLNSTKPYTD